MNLTNNEKNKILDLLSGEESLQKKSEAEKYKEKFIPVSVNDLKKKTPNPFPWLVEGLIPERAITTFAADSGSGKSLLALYVADRIGKGKKLFNQIKTKQSNVLIIEQEMSEDDNIDRAINICQENNNVFILYENKWLIENDIHYKILINFIKKKNIKFLVFDTLSKIHTKDENSNTEMTKVMIKLLDLCKEFQITILLIHHHNKDQEKKGKFRGRGASAISDNSASWLEIKSKTCEDEMGCTVLAMDLKQDKTRKRTAILKCGVNIINMPDNSVIFEYRENAIKEQDNIDLCKPKILEFVKNNPGLTKNKVVKAINGKGLPYNAVYDAVDVLIYLKQLDVQAGPRRSKILFLPTDVSQVKFL